MNNPLIGENLFLLYSVGMGIFITFVYDLFRILRRVFPHGSFWVSFEDLIFWVFCALSVFWMMHSQSNGTLRWFAVLGALTGMFVYIKTVSGLFVKWVSVLIRKIVEIIGKVLGFLGRPFAFLGKKCRQAMRCCNIRLKRFGRFVKNRLTALWKMLKIKLCKQQ